ncbi:hypothetical protein CDD81_4835 [Ophiocordyceps australis]|uniref:Uncharacterized protein n=1 Tax=Ophiocordyceps australis TaxID=1399860 RepID=A0A2C5YBG6_9HYPO|nr:hypothetical protein CDD81_4835 [Ophiocordyceps australis]
MSTQGSGISDETMFEPTRDFINQLLRSCRVVNRRHRGPRPNETMFSYLFQRMNDQRGDSDDGQDSGDEENYDDRVISGSKGNKSTTNSKSGSTTLVSQSTSPTSVENTLLGALVSDSQPCYCAPTSRFGAIGDRRVNHIRPDPLPTIWEHQVTSIPFPPLSPIRQHHVISIPSPSPPPILELQVPFIPPSPQPTINIYLSEDEGSEHESGEGGDLEIGNNEELGNEDEGSEGGYSEIDNNEELRRQVEQLVEGMNSYDVDGPPRQPPVDQAAENANMEARLAAWLGSEPE